MLLRHVHLLFLLLLLSFTATVFDKQGQERTRRLQFWCHSALLRSGLWSCSLIGCTRAYHLSLCIVSTLCHGSFNKVHFQVSSSSLLLKHTLLRHVLFNDEKKMRFDSVLVYFLNKILAFNLGIYLKVTWTWSQSVMTWARILMTCHLSFLAG